MEVPADRIVQVILNTPHAVLDCDLLRVSAPHGLLFRGVEGLEQDCSSPVRLLRQFGLEITPGSDAEAEITQSKSGCRVRTERAVCPNWCGRPAATAHDTA